MQELISIFIDNMIPVLAIAAVGFFMRRRFAVDPRMISRMMFNVFSPALIFNALFIRDISGVDFLRVYGGTLLLSWTIAAISVLALRWRKIEPSEKAATLVSTFAFNGGNFGLSIVSFAFGAEALSYAVLIFVAGTTTAYTLGVYISSNGRASVAQSLSNVLRTPSVYALVLVFALKGHRHHAVAASYRAHLAIAGGRSHTDDVGTAWLATGWFRETEALATGRI